MADRYASLKQGLVGCWIPSVSGSGLLLPDLSGRGNNGSLVGMDASDWVSSQYGRALDFDGVNDKVTATHSLGVSVPQCTFSVWMQKASASDIAISSIGSETVNSRFHMSWFSDGQLYCTVENGSGSYGEFTPSLTTNFRNYCLVYDGTQTTNANKLRVFLGGQQISLNYTGTIPATAISNNAVTIGAGSGSFSKSQQDDIRLYNRALTESEIRLLASEPGIGFKPAKKLSRFSQRFTYKPDKPRNYGVIRNRDPNYSTLKHGLVAAYCPSISGQGNVLPDLVGGNHGTLTGMDASDWVASGDGRALDFDGSNDFIEFSSSALLGGSGSITLASHARANSLTFSSNAIIGKMHTTNDQPAYLLGVQSTGQLYFITTNGSAGGAQEWLSTSSVVSTGSWYHLGVSYAWGSGASLKAYVNGSQVTGSWTTGNGDVTFTGTATLTQKIGRLQHTGVNTFFSWNGTLDDTRAYNRALSESEIKLLASKRGIGLEPRKPKITFTDLGVQKAYSVVRVKETDYGNLRQGLVGAWCPSLPNGGSGNTLPDVSGFNNHGSLVNMGPDDWVSGQYGRALDFDGSNDNVRVAFARPSFPFTMTCWALTTTDTTNEYSLILCRSTADDGQFSILWGGAIAGDYIYARQEPNTGGGLIAARSQNAFAINKWTHVVAVFRSNTYRQIYVDGVAGVEDTTNVASPTVDRLAIGRFDRPTPGGAFLGQIDDCRVYSRELSESEIKLLATRPGIGLRQESHRNTFYQFPSGARRRRILTGMP